MEVNETQISKFPSCIQLAMFLSLTPDIQSVKTKLDSPSGPKIKKKNAAEPTMTLHTRAATDDIYDIFNAPLKPASVAGDETGDDDDDGDEDDDDDGDEDEDEDMTDAYYGSDAESTSTTKQTHQGEQEDDEAADAINMGE